MNWLIKGCLLGISIGLLVGPLFFTMIHSGIKWGIRRGLYFAIGTWLSDFILLFSTLFLVGWVVLPKNTEELNPIIIWVAAIVLLLIGIFIISKKADNDDDKDFEVKAQDWLHILIQGFLVNTANPAAFFIWLGLATMIRNLNIEKSIAIYIQFYLGVICMIILLDMTKIYAGKYLSTKFSDRVLSKVQWISGSAFIISGVILIFKVIQL